MKKLRYLKVSMNRNGASDICSKILQQLPNDMKEINLSASSFCPTNHFHEVAPVSIVFFLNKINNNCYNNNFV